MIKRFNVNFKMLDDEMEALRRVDAKVLPNTFRAFQDAGAKLISAIKRVSVEKNVGRRSGEYLRKWQEGYQYPYKGDPLELRFENDSPQALVIEEGRKQVDMLPHYLQSAKTRVNAKGKPYLIIPFRHGTPGTVSMGAAMPDEVHQVVKSREFGASRRLPRTYFSPNIHGRPATRYTYKWGGRYSAGENQMLHIPEGKSWAAGKYEGMVKMGKQGSNKQTGYFTFRVASAESRLRDPNAWVLPPLAGKYVAETALNQMAPFVEESLVSAFQKDIEGIAVA